MTQLGKILQDRRSRQISSLLMDAIEDMKDFMTKKYQEFSGSGPSFNTEGLRLSITILWKMAVSYLDIVRDIVLVILILNFSGHIGLFGSDSLLFQNVVIWILIATIEVPLFVSATLTSARHPLTVFEFRVWNNFRNEQPGWRKMAFIRFVVFSCYMFVPAFLIFNKANAKLRRQTLQELGKVEYEKNEGNLSNCVLEEMEQIEVYLDEVRRAALIWKKTQSALELVTQQSIQLTMLLLSTTTYTVDHNSGLQGIFSEDSEDLFALSLCWSLRTGVSSFLKIHSEQKAGMTSGPGKGVPGLRALLFSITRIICVIAFFGPFLGHGDCLAHWHAEGIELEAELLQNIQGSASYWDRATVDLMYRTQDYTNYTLVTLQAAFFTFFGILLLQGIAIFVLKINVRKSFKSIGLLNQIGHVIESLHVPDVYHYQHKLNTESHMKPSDYKLAYHSIQKETFWMTFVQMVSNLFLLVPLLVAGGLMKLLLTNFSSSFQSERETLCSCGQHRNLSRGGQGLQAADHLQCRPALPRPGDLGPRRPAGTCLPQVVPPLEDHPAGGQL